MKLKFLSGALLGGRIGVADEAGGQIDLDIPQDAVGQANVR